VTAKLIKKQAFAQTRLPDLERESRSLTKIVNELDAAEQAERNRGCRSGG
jgi:hypothetical protein